MLNEAVNSDDEFLDNPLIIDETGELPAADTGKKMTNSDLQQGAFSPSGHLVDIKKQTKSMTVPAKNNTPVNVCVQKHNKTGLGVNVIPIENMHGGYSVFKVDTNIIHGNGKNMIIHLDTRPKASTPQTSCTVTVSKQSFINVIPTQSVNKSGLGESSCNITNSIKVNPIGAKLTSSEALQNNLANTSGSTCRNNVPQTLPKTGINKIVSIIQSDRHSSDPTTTPENSSRQKSMVSLIPNHLISQSSIKSTTLNTNNSNTYSMTVNNELKKFVQSSVASSQANTVTQSTVSHEQHTSSQPVFISGSNRTARTVIVNGLSQGTSETATVSKGLYRIIQPVVGNSLSKGNIKTLLVSSSSNRHSQPVYVSSQTYKNTKPAVVTSGTSKTLKPKQFILMKSQSGSIPKGEDLTGYKRVLISSEQLKRIMPGVLSNQGKNQSAAKQSTIPVELNIPSSTTASTSVTAVETTIGTEVNTTFSIPNSSPTNRQGNTFPTILKHFTPNVEGNTETTILKGSGEIIATTIHKESSPNTGSTAKTVSNECTQNVEGNTNTTVLKSCSESVEEVTTSDHSTSTVNTIKDRTANELTDFQLPVKVLPANLYSTNALKSSLDKFINSDETCCNPNSSSTVVNDNDKTDDSSSSLINETCSNADSSITVVNQNDKTNDISNSLINDPLLPNILDGSGTSESVSLTFPDNEILEDPTPVVKIENLDVEFIADVANESDTSGGSLEVSSETSFNDTLSAVKTEPLTDMGYTAAEAMPTIGTNQNSDDDAVNNDDDDDVKAFVCQGCWAVFRDNDALDDHVCPPDSLESSFTATEKRMFTCGHCNKIFYDRYLVKRHMMTHTGVKDYLCDLCNKSFLLKHQLINHMGSHYEIRPFHCQICSAGFKRSSHLFKHRLSHTYNRERRFTCLQCDASFYMKDKLERHVRTHLPEKQRYVCEFCHKQYSFRDTLKKHVNQCHVEETAPKKIRRAFKCGFCDAEFFVRKQMKVHLLGHEVMIGADEDIDDYCERAPIREQDSNEKGGNELKNNNIAKKKTHKSKH